MCKGILDLKKKRGTFLLVSLAWVDTLCAYMKLVKTRKSPVEILGCLTV